MNSTKIESSSPTTTSATKIPEILAPVGGREQFYAALNSGADAVFLGLKNFNARARAENFTMADLRELVPLAQKHEMKVLVTMNILIKNAELHSLLSTLAELEDVGVHAIIVQDLGLARLCNTYFPRLRLHASTQMAVHNCDGVIEAIKAGMKRVVLARELTAIEIKRIRAAIPQNDVEIEVFCHGSLCYSYSGLCFFSGAEDARSGNRGECAYTCRKPYKIINEPGHGFLFSMKDLNTIDSLHLLVDAGVDALKIEGRKKDAQYVSTVIQSYRKKLDELFGRPTLRTAAPHAAHALYSENKNLSSESLKDQLQLSFQRDSTSFFLKGRYAENVIDLNNPTHKGQRVGVIEAVGEQWIEFMPESDLERFDGIRIDPSEALYHSTPQHGQQLSKDLSGVSQKYQNETLQFSLRRMSQNGQSVAVAVSGRRLRVELPENLNGVKVGDVVVRTRSDALRREVERMSKPSPDSHFKPYDWIDTHINFEVESDEIIMRISCAKHDSALVSISKTFPALRPKNAESNLTRDLEETFKVFGNINFTSRLVSVNGDAHWFVPRSKLKELKRELEDVLPGAVSSRKEERVMAALEAATFSTRAHTTAGKSDSSRFALKIDRLEYLEWIKSFLDENQRESQLKISEIVFEPKRAFLKDMSFDDTVSALLGFKRSTGISVRLAFPTVLRAWDEPLMRRWYETFVKNGIVMLEAGNVGVLNKITEWNRGEAIESVSSDFTLYTLNTAAARHWKDRGLDKVTLSVEDDQPNIADLMSSWPEGLTAQAILYKDTPLFIAESCSLTALHNGCPTNAVCGYRTLEIENENKERFFVAHESCKSVVYDSKSFSLTHKRAALEQLGIRHFRIDFLTRPYSEEELKSVLLASAHGQLLKNTHTANFNRKLL